VKLPVIACCLGSIIAFSSWSFAQEQFDSADSAAQALITAAQNHDSASLSLIFGPEGNAIATSGDADQDKTDQSEFSRLARAKHELIPDARNPNRMILSIGEEDWPFPVPIVRSNGKWSFDASEAEIEIQGRHIGINELDAIEICAGYVEAQRKYASEDYDKDGVLEYAPRVTSSAGGHDGLYREGEDDSLVPRTFADATWDLQKNGTKPYHGYFFRMLYGQGIHAPGGLHNYLVKGKLVGGFGLVAWPAEYGVTGIYTYIVNQDGEIYQKDIPPNAASIPLPITRYDPDPSWRRID
jgi:hypothetical protein